jgi:hypothetical protein
MNTFHDPILGNLHHPQVNIKHVLHSIAHDTIWNKVENNLWHDECQYEIKEFHKNLEEMEMNATHPLSVYTDDVTLLGKKINTEKV